VSVQPFTVKHFEKWTGRLILDTGEPWQPEPFQLAFVKDVFAGHRECWLIVPQGNGKTTLVAGLALYYLEHHPNAAIPIAAAATDQANQLYLQAQGFVIRSDWMYELAPDLLAQATGKRKSEMPRFECQRGFRRVRHHKGGFLEIRPSDDRTGDGIIPGGLAICDELHRHESLALYRTWQGKLKKRNAQIIVISTAGEPGSDFENLREEFRRKGEMTREHTFTRASEEGISVIHDWAVPEDGNVEDLELVAEANPFSGVTKEELDVSRRSPSWELGHWRRFTCNLPTRTEAAAITENEWLGAQVQEDIPENEPVDVGLDLGWKHDTTFAQPLWVRDTEYRLFARGKMLVPPRNGNTLHPDLVKNALVEIHARNPIRRVVMDISNGMDISSWIEEEFGCDVIDRGQSNKYACEDYEHFMEALRQGWIKHDGNQDLSKHAMNAIARAATYGDLRFDRPASSRSAKSTKQDRRVIDGLTAAAMVHTSAAIELVSGDAGFAFV
jgi:phage terminase large subunit-like protein